MGCLSLKSLEEIPMEHKLSAVQVLLHTCSIEIIALKKKGVPIFKAFRKGPLIRHTSQGGIAHRAESPDCQPCWFRPWRHEVARSGGQVPQGEGTKAGGPSQEPRAMALGPGFPKWWGGVEFWNQYPIFEHTNQPCPLETISALLSQASKMVLYIVIPYSILLHFRSLGHRIIFYLNRPWKVWSLMVKVFIPWVTSFQVLTPGDLLLCRQGKDRFPGECHKGKRCFERSHQPGSSHPGRLDWWGRSFSCWGLAPFGSWPSRRRQEHLGSCHKLCAGQAKGYQAQHRTSSASCSQNVGRELILVCWMDIMDQSQLQSISTFDQALASKTIITFSEVSMVHQQVISKELYWISAFKWIIVSTLIQFSPHQIPKLISMQAWPF